MEVLNEDFILSGDEINEESLFSSEEDTSPEEKDLEKEKKDKETTEEEEVNPEDLFDNPESVGSDKEEKDKEKNTSSEGTGTSPKTNFYASIAGALSDDGILPNLDKDKINTPEDFANAIEEHIKSQLDERQRRIDEALNANVEVDTIRQYESTLNYLDSIQDKDINDESEKGEMLRKKLIFQDLINKGYTKERANREIKKSFDAGTDIEDAKDALESNKEYFNKAYDSLIEENQNEIKKEQEKQKVEASQLKKSLLNDKEVFEGISLDKTLRQKAYDNITKPVYKTDDGEYLTAIQKYEQENPVEFRKYLSVLFTMTDGFKSLDKIVKGKVKKEVSQSIRELEHRLKNNTRMSGNPTFLGYEDDTESISRGWSIDV